ncbi:hypothetical protein CGZ93_00890 [Enemella dayhoffiae]|uniref:Uncharacterized protein n=1 Tax=Enemella dayhoffiae TaxID=2016507 RepID=A0A255HFB6_9ACTN|nr:hypothetical protein [Enemella dayhoffiae]OYO25054.1 hypothetical protein CGZ93_00890 [Enemella dayhoffiae]
MRQIAGIGIGPDPRRRGQLSDGGDSGAVWVFKDRSGRPTTVMAGLHFGGDGPSGTADHALACRPQAAFNRLQVTLSPTVAGKAAAQAAEAARAAVGFQPDFLGHPRCRRPAYAPNSNETWSAWTAAR